MNKHYIGIYLRGLAMGAADVVPGVSGGTVAFITGIYEELINSLRAMNITAIKVLFSQGPAACWRHINGNFLIALGLGIVTSIVTLARGILFLLETQPLLVWSFFFGLILASSLYIARQIRQWDRIIILAFVIGCATAVGIAEVKPAQVPADLPFVFIAGAIAICAMVLPGISGSFMLVLMGMYQHIMGAVKSADWVLLLTFMAGAGLGLLSFVHLLGWLLSRFHDRVMAVLTGFLFGSLYLVWPWKQVLSYYQNGKGESLALEQQNVMPWVYEQLTGLSSKWLSCGILVVVGVILVLGLEYFGQKIATGDK